MGLGTSKICQISVCVEDLRKAEKSYTALLGVEPIRFKLSPFKEVPAFTHGKPDHGMQKIDFLVYNLEGGIALEVYGPCPEGTPAQEFLKKHGPGVMNFAFMVNDRKLAYDEIAKVCEQGQPYHEGYFPDCTYSFVDTFEELGTELNIKQLVDNRQNVKDILAVYPND